MRSTSPGRYLIFFLVKFQVECTQNHVWGPLGPRYEHICKTYGILKIHLYKPRGKHRRAVVAVVVAVAVAAVVVAVWRQGLRGMEEECGGWNAWVAGLGGLRRMEEECGGWNAWED